MNVTCTICTDLFDNTSDIVTVPCGHVFHSQCIYQWVESTEIDSACPECRTNFTKKDILKLYFNFAPNSNADIPTLKNDIQGLSSQLLKTGMDLRYTERKRRELQMYNAGIEKSLKHLYQKMRKLKSALDASQQYAESLRNKSELLTRENHHLIHELPRDKSIPAMPGCLVEADEILHRIVLEVTSTCGTSMGKRMIQYCDIIRRELRLVEISLAKGTDAFY